MACKICSRNLVQLSCRQALTFSAAEPQAIAIARQLSRPTATPLHVQQQRQQHQQRSFGTTPRCQKSWIPKSVKDNLSQLVQRTAAPYQVHQATEIIYKTCARQATYTISQTDRRNGTVAKTEEGEEIGEGSTMWHEGK
jgi:cytochrome b pre-mRNA-processing protein 3